MCVGGGGGGRWVSVSAHVCLQEMVVLAGVLISDKNTKNEFLCV